MDKQNRLLIDHTFGSGSRTIGIYRRRRETTVAKLWLVARPAGCSLAGCGWWLPAGYRPPLAAEV